MRLATLNVSFVLLLVGAGCYPSNILEESLRDVETVELPTEWYPVEATTFPGAYASEQIEGPAASSMVEIRYLFHPDGAYTGAALVLGDLHLQYETLSGTWTLLDGVLTLDNAEPGFPIEAASDRVRISSDLGTVVLRRVELR